MKRNNSSRLGDLLEGGSPRDVDPTAAAQNENSNSMSFIVATDIVTLPSYGLFYPEQHELHGVESIEIKQMTAKEEDILTNTSYIKNGTVLDRLLSSLMVDKTINLDSMMVNDKTALLVAARKSAYGVNYEASVNCPSCTSKNTIQIDLDEVLDVDPPDLENLSLDGSVSVSPTGTLMITLPRTGAVFEMRPRIGADDKENQEKTKRLKKLKLNRQQQTDSLSDIFKQVTVSVNGDTTPGVIKSAFDVLPAFDFRFLRSAYQDGFPNVNLFTMLECTTCGAEEVVSVPMNADFFWPDLKVQRTRL